MFFVVVYKSFANTTVVWSEASAGTSMHQEIRAMLKEAMRVRCLPYNTW